MSVQIPLSQGYVAFVDDCDVALLIAWRWKVLKVREQRYAVRTAGRKTMLMHRVIMNAPLLVLIDHRDGNGLNNRRENLRLCNNVQNSGNVTAPVRGKSQYRGVYWNNERKKWQSQIGAGLEKGKQKVKYLGRFESEIDAAQAYDAAAIAYFGEFATLNFPRSVLKDARR